MQPYSYNKHNRTVLHHPHPALLEKEDISKEKLDQQKKVVTRFENKLQERVQQLLLQKQKIEMKQQQIKQLSTELKIEDVDKESFIKALDVISKDEKEMKKKYLQYQDELKYIQKLKKSVELSQKYGCLSSKRRKTKTST